jgi:signal transduction histidine kinase
MGKNGDNILVLLLLSMGGAFLLIVSFILMYVRNQNKMLKQREQLQYAQIAHQQELIQTVIASQETERKRIGQDLHDDVGTALSNLRMIIEMLDYSNAESLKAFTKNCKNIIDKTINDVRHISHNLSPQGIELYGFMGAVEDLCDFISQTGKLQVNIVKPWDNLPRTLDATAEISLYRVIEELLNNTIKHAGASLVIIKFSIEDDRLIINYRDNGRGILLKESTKTGMGMRNIESRLGIIGAVFRMSNLESWGFNMQISMKIA